MPGRFADPSATRRVDLGEGDYALVRDELSGPEIDRFVGSRDDEAAGVLANYIVEWNLTGKDGEVVPIDGESVFLLKAPTLAPIVDAISAVIGESAAVPNAPGARSPGTSRASASRTRTTRARR